MAKDVQEEENSRLEVIRRYRDYDYTASSFTNNFSRQPVGNAAVCRVDFAAPYIIAPQITHATATASSYAGTHNVNDSAAYMIAQATNAFYGTPTALQGLNAAAAGLIVSPSPALMPTSHMLERTQGNNTSSAADEGSASKRPKLSQSIHADYHPTTIKNMKKPVGRPRKDSYSLNQPPTQRQKRQTSDAIHMYPRSIQIGNWMVINKYGYDLTAKCYYGKRSLVWEYLCREVGQKKRMTLEWKFITSIEITSSLPPQDYEVLRVVVSKAPIFAEETKITTGTHSTWGKCEDFTNGQALSCTTHVLEFKRGKLSDDFKKMLKDNLELRKLTHASSSSDELVKLDGIPDQEQLPKGSYNPQGTVTSSSHSSRIDDVAGTDEVLSAYDPLIQNNQAANIQPNWDSYCQDVVDALSSLDS